MHNLDETTSPALFGFDLFGLLSLRIRPRGFTLAILPRRLLALGVSFTSQGQVVSGKVLGRGLYGEVEESKQGQPFFECWADESVRALRLGRLRLELDRKSWERASAARQAGLLEG